MKIGWKGALISIAIAIILVSFFNAGIAAFYDAPDRDKCYDRDLRPISQKNCYDIENNQSRNECLEAEKAQQAEDKECYAVLDAENDVYSRNVFIILVIAGFIALGAGLFFKRSDAVSYGLMGGGVLSLIFGVIRYWSNMHEYLRFIILGIALIALIWIAYKWFKK